MKKKYEIIFLLIKRSVNNFTNKSTNSNRPKVGSNHRKPELRRLPGDRLVYTRLIYYVSLTCGYFLNLSLIYYHTGP